MGDVIGHLNSIRGQVQGMEARGNAQVIKAKVPLATMFGYVNTLSLLLRSRTIYHAIAHYDQVPQNIAEDISLSLSNKAINSPLYFFL